MQVNKRFFPSLKKAHAYVSTFIQHTDRLEPEDALWLVRDVLSKHPNWKRKSDKLKCIKLRRYRGHKMIMLVKSDGSEEDISYRQAILGANSPRIDTLRALRHAVDADVKKFRVSAFADSPEVPCALCDAPCHNTSATHIDHVKLFAAIVGDFLQVEGKAIEEIESVSVGIHRCLTNKDLQKRWQDFHREHATLRVTCAHCNLTRPQ